MAPTLLFCVGATKASTTWLYRFLSGHPDCHLRSIKELHYFDRLDAGKTKPAIASLQESLDRIRSETRKSATLGTSAKIKDIEAWRGVLQSPNYDAYVSYLIDGIGVRRLVADITPSYALLSADRFREMAAILPDVRFVYLIRDPVARLWSHIRMSAFRRNGDLETEAGDVFEAALDGKQPDILARGDYCAAISQLDASVDPSRLLVMFQEVLLTVSGVKHLCSFLGIADHSADFANRVHFGPNLAMTSDQLLRARAALRPQYEYASARFGKLPEAWLRNMGESLA